MDEGLSHETLAVFVPSQGLAHLGLVSLSSYLITNTQQISTVRGAGNASGIFSVYTDRASS